MPPPQKLRELIRQVRQCKSAAEERAVIANEMAAIRDAFRDRNKVEFRHHNVAKLMYVDMLGYPTHFGQMEVLKLLASPGFPEKRVGYLALMQLLDEKAQVLMLATQSLQNDMQNDNSHIVGLAVCAAGNIGSEQIARDLGLDLERLLRNSNPHIRKKAFACAIRVVQRAPEYADEYFKAAMLMLEDKSQPHGVVVAAAQLIRSICLSKDKYRRKVRKQLSHVINRLKSLLIATYDPDHDIGGVTDPFIQAELLALLRYLAIGDRRTSDAVNDVLAMVATNTESNKNSGNAILYECVRTIMSIEADSSLHVLGINILGRFLVNRDNNIRYVALNALCKCVDGNTQAIQRHRNTIIECLKDGDITIRRRALELIYALTNRKNIKNLVKDLLGFLALSYNEPEFRSELASRICTVVERFSPNTRWHVDTIIEVMSAVPELVNDGVISNIFVLVANKPELQPYTTFNLYQLLEEGCESESMRKLAAWCIGEYGTVLTSPEGASTANIEPNLNFTPKTELEIVETMGRILNGISTHSSTKCYIVTAFAKLCDKFGGSPAVVERMQELMRSHMDSIKLELQQRTVEFEHIVSAIAPDVRSRVLGAMPVPDLQTFADRSLSRVNSTSNTGAGTAEQSDGNMSDTSEESQSSGTESETDDSDHDSKEVSESSDEEDRRDSRRHHRKSSSGRQNGSRHRDDHRHRDRHSHRSRATESDTLPPTLPGPSISNATSPSKPQDNGMPMFDDLIMGTGSSATTAPSAAPVSTGLDDLLGLSNTSAPVSSGSPVSAVPAAVSQPPVVNRQSSRGTAATDAAPSQNIYTGNGVNVNFRFAKRVAVGVCRVMATFTNTDTTPVTNFQFSVSVPKYIELNLLPASGRDLQPMSSNSHTQKLQLTNSFPTDKKMVIKFQVAFERNGQSVVDTAKYDGFPPGSC